LKYLFIALLCLSLCGCATIITGTTQKIPVASNPEGARLDVDGQCAFTTPVVLKLERKRDHVLVFSKEGYQQQTITLLHTLSGAVCANILGPSIYGWGVDAGTGAQYKLIPERVNVQMTQERTAEK
jgi:hypothetical protein